MRLLTLFGCEAIEIPNGYSQLVIEVPELFWQYQQFLRGDDEIKGAYSENNKVLKVKTSVAFIGDLANMPDVNVLFGKKVNAQLQHYCSEDSQARLYQLNNQLKTILMQQIEGNGLPFGISEEWSLEALFKYCKLTLLPPENHSASGIIRYLIDTASQLGDDRLFVVNDMRRYLRDADHIDVINVINELHLNVLELRQTGTCPPNLDAKAFHVIDQDFVMF